MSFEWSEKEKKYTMFTGDEIEDVEEKFKPKAKKKNESAGKPMIIGIDKKKDVKCKGEKSNK